MKLYLIYSFDHQKYEKWGIVQALEMFQLPPDVKQELLDEGFGVRWRDNAPFTSVCGDHSTEWVNKFSKSSGGFSTMTQNESASLRYV